MAKHEPRIFAVEGLLAVVDSWMMNLIELRTTHFLLSTTKVSSLNSCNSSEPLFANSKPLKNWELSYFKCSSYLPHYCLAI